MPIKIEAAYCKKLGLPNYSSHSFVVSVHVDVDDVSKIDAETEKLYRLLQRRVDRSLRRVGYMPDALSYGMKRGVKPAQTRPLRVLKSPLPENDGWTCEAAQRAVILSLVEEYKLKKSDVEDLARQMFGVGVRALDRTQATRFVEELLKRYA